ncbi:RHS repeat-associated core domain-containing protein, partial [Sphingobium yanoikuyae]|uniref:RHS repeat-associated core domain-containing protein n=1 Tax=Sphingobium yanoikuyae TaxID=13690 RepID=UPI00289F89CF
LSANPRSHLCQMFRRRTVVYDWNFANEMTFVRENGATSGVGVLAAYTYDNLGRRTEIARSNGTSTILGYNPGSQLTSLAQNLAGTANDQTLGFTFNPAGQMITRSSSNDGYAFSQQYNAGRSYTVNGLNQYVTAGSAQPTYDGRGNLVSSQGKSYSYSSENYMLSAPGLAMSYDPLGRLYQSAGTATARRAYDGMSLVVEYNGSNVMQRRYVPGPSMDEPVLWYEGSGTTDRRWYHSDERGSVISLSDGTGAVVAINRYDEWGNPQSSNVGAFQYTGQIWLSEAGLYYYKARMYDPRLGRFMQADPIRYGGGMNLYAYVRNDPLNLLDPLGRQSCGPQSGFGPCSNQGSTGLGQLDGGLLTATFDMSDDPPGSDYGASNLDFIWGGGLTSIVAPLQLPQKPQPPKTEPFDPAKDYCGSGGGNVPDGNWKRSCKAHDDCYGTPGAVKEMCDIKLARDMTLECGGVTGGQVCAIPGTLYGLGLILLGWTPFWHPSRDAYNAAQGN